MPTIVLVIVAILTLVVPSAAAAQDSATLPIDLGTPIETYRYQFRYVVSVARDSCGNVRDITVEIGTLVGGALSADASMTDDEISGLIDVFAPAAARGARTKYYGFTVCQGVCADLYNYENVDISYGWYPLHDGCRHAVLNFHWHDKAPYSMPRPGPEERVTTS